MKHLFKILFYILFPFLVNAQQSYPDSLRQALENTSVDLIKVDLNLYLADFYEEKNLDSALYFAEQAVLIARKENQKLAEAAALNRKGYQLLSIGNMANHYKV